MPRISPATRISTGLVCLALCVLLLAQAIGVSPDPVGVRIEARRRWCEALFASCAIAAERDDTAGMVTVLRAVVSHAPDVVEATLRTPRGTDVTIKGLGDGAADPANKIVLPISRGGSDWGELDLQFVPASPVGRLAILSHPVVRFLTFFMVVAFVSYWLFLRKVLQYLDPSAVISRRVTTMLDALAEGVAVLDMKGRIVLANKSFSRTLGRAAPQLVGAPIDSLPWNDRDSRRDGHEYPWDAVTKRRLDHSAASLHLEGSEGARSLMVNAVPVIASDQTQRGTLVTFDDLTPVEQTNDRLREALADLERSRQEIERQNAELQLLARTDPLTGCMNRRAFCEMSEIFWSNARRHGHPLVCVMLDIDHFKRINDTHGHGVGDIVLQQVARMIKSSLRSSDLVCRYGGEEFCILLVETGVEGGTQTAERLRQEIERHPCSGVSITASLGLAEARPHVASIQNLLTEADTALYAAKRSGRNRVVRSDQMPEEEIAEVRRRAGTQFDPNPVERCIKSTPATCGHNVQDSGAPATMDVTRLRGEVLALGQAAAAHDLESIAQAARDLASGAALTGLTEVAAMADKVGASFTAHADIESVIALANELISMCQSACEPPRPTSPVQTPHVTP